MNPEHAMTLARYNQWMNARLYDTCGQLADEERKSDRSLFFHSIHGTLNHLLLTDRVWMGRFVNQPFEVTGTDQELFDDFSELREARAETDGLILEWAGGLTEAELAGDLHFRTISNPAERSCTMWLVVTHFFNHQTHHRGQITAALSQLGRDYGVTDLFAMPDPDE